MSGKEFRACSPDGGVALVASTPKTALQIQAGANNFTEIDHYDVSFDGVTPTDQPVQILIERQTTAPGTPGTAPSVSENPNGDVGTLQVAAVTGGGTEPTSSDDYGRWYFHPQGRHVIPGPFYIVGGDRQGVVLNAPANVNVHVTAKGKE